MIWSHKQAAFKHLSSAIRYLEEAKHAANQAGDPRDGKLNDTIIGLVQLQVELERELNHETAKAAGEPLLYQPEMQEDDTVDGFGRVDELQ